MLYFLFRRVRFVVVLCLFIAAEGIYAQEQSSSKQQSDTIATETLDAAIAMGSARPSATNQTVPIQVLDNKEIERLGVQELYEAVRTFSGVSIRDYGGVGGLKTVSIRSLGSQHTAVCYDGITISNAQSGQVDIGRFSLDNVEQLSLSIGQSDDIFQTARLFASSGALNIKTSKPVFKDIPFHITAQMKVASFGTYNPYILYQQKLGEKWSLSINGDWMTSKGNYPFKLNNGDQITNEIRINSDVNTSRGEINLYTDMGKGGNLSFKGNYLYSERGLPGSVVLYNKTATERLWDRNFFASIHYNNKFSNKWALLSNFKYNYAWNRYLIKSDIYESGEEDNRYNQNEYYGSVATEYSPFEFLRFTLAEDFFVNTLVSNIPESQTPLRYTSLTALAAQYHSPRLTVTLSLLETYITERVKTGEAASDKSRLSPAASISYKLLKEHNFRVRFSYKDAFRAPNFNDLYYARVGNKNLNPEKASQFNLGLTWNGVLIKDIIDYASVSLDGYYNMVKDKIVAIPTLFIWKMMNMGRVNMWGSDVNISSTFSLPCDMTIVLGGAYSFQYAIDMSDPSSKTYKHQIPYTPRHSGSVSLSWNSRWISAGYIMTAVGERYALPQNVQANKIDGYFDHSVSLHHTFNLKKCKLRIQGEVINIGDVNYDVIRYYPMPGRSYRLTIKFIL